MSLRESVRRAPSGRNEVAVSNDATPACLRLLPPLASPRPGRRKRKNATNEEGIERIMLRGLNILADHIRYHAARTAQIELISAPVGRRLFSQRSAHRR